MKWFKHQSTARNDEKIARLEDKCGLEGYGFYFKMLELVAEVIDSTDRCEVTYSMSRWGRQTNVTTKKWLFLSSCCADVGLMIVQRCNDDITVNIPNLLKYRDNHTKNLQVTSKQDKEEYKEDKEKEEDKEKIKEVADATAQPKKPKVKTTPTKNHETAMLLSAGIDLALVQDFLKIRKTKITQTAMDAIVREAGKAGIDVSDAVRICVERSWQSFNSGWDWNPTQKSLNPATNRNSGFAKPTHERPAYVYQGKQGAIDSTAEIIHDSLRFQ